LAGPVAVAQARGDVIAAEQRSLLTVGCPVAVGRVAFVSQLMREDVGTLISRAQRFDGCVRRSDRRWACDV
jgi:hypothetical protein